jgi:hypothetical protein
MHNARLVLISEFAVPISCARLVHESIENKAQTDERTRCFGLLSKGFQEVPYSEASLNSTVIQASSLSRGTPTHDT